LIETTVMIKSSFFICVFFLVSNSTKAQSMNNQKLESIIYTISDTITGQPGQWKFMIKELPMFCLTDELHNRMRIISPIVDVSEMSPEDVKKCMEANFHSALDVRYSISEDVLWVAFIHPLKELSKEQVIDAVRQVYSAVLTYGSSFSSSNLTFPTSDENKTRMN